MTLVLGTLQLHGPLVVWNNLEFALCVSQDEILTLLCFVVLITLEPCESVYVFCPESKGVFWPLYSGQLYALWKCHGFTSCRRELETFLRIKHDHQLPVGIEYCRDPGSDVTSESQLHLPSGCLNYLVSFLSLFISICSLMGKPTRLKMDVNRIWVDCNVYGCHLVNYCLVFFIVSLVWLVVVGCWPLVNLSSLLQWLSGFRMFCILVEHQGYSNVWRFDVFSAANQMISLIGISVNIGRYLNPHFHFDWQISFVMVEELS